MGRIAVLISAWNEERLLPDCLASLTCLPSTTFTAFVLDGAYETYLAASPDHPRVWRSKDQTEAVTRHWGAQFIEAPISSPWATEAAKKSYLVSCAVTARHTTALFLDADERLESTRLMSWVAEVFDHPSMLWAYIDRFRPDQVWSKREAAMPRLLAINRDVRFVGAGDFMIEHGDLGRIAQIDGDPIPLHLTNRFTHIPSSVACIRHERRLRTKMQHDMNGRYAVERRRRFGIM